MAIAKPFKLGAEGGVAAYKAIRAVVRGHVYPFQAAQRQMLPPVRMTGRQYRHSVRKVSADFARYVQNEKGYPPAWTSTRDAAADYLRMKKRQQFIQGAIIYPKRAGPSIRPSYDSTLLGSRVPVRHKKMLISTKVVRETVRNFANTADASWVDRMVHTGPNGGRYVMTKYGKKTYLRDAMSMREQKQRGLPRG